MNQVKKACFFILIAMIVLGCQNDTISLDLTLAPTLSSIELRVELPGARTAVPAALTDADRLVIIMTSADYPAIVQNQDITGGIAQAQISSVRPGTWTITVHLEDIDANDAILYRGEQELTVAPATDYSVTILLESTSGATINFDFTLEQALYDDEAGGTVPFLDTPNDMIISPAGDNIYVASYYDDAISVFTRDATTGRLTHVESYQDSAAGLLTNLDGPMRMAISGDGSNVYVTSEYDAAITVFSRDGGNDGVLSFQESIPVALGFDNSGANIESPVVEVFGDQVYVGAVEGTIYFYDRTGPNGTLVNPRSVVEQFGHSTYLDYIEVYDIAISPDGEYLFALVYDYVVSTVYHLVTFDRDTITGDLAATSLQVINSGDADGDGLSDSLRLEVTPDQGHLYVASQDGSYVSYMAIYAVSAVDGSLTWIEKITTGGTNSYAGVVNIANDTDIYVGGYSAGTSALYNRDTTTGALTKVKEIPGYSELFIAAETVTTPPIVQIYGIDQAASKLYLLSSL